MQREQNGRHQKTQDQATHKVRQTQQLLLNQANCCHVFAETTIRSVKTSPQGNTSKTSRTPRTPKISLAWVNTTASNAQNGLRLSTILWRIAREKITREGRSKHRVSIRVGSLLTMPSLQQTANPQRRCAYTQDCRAGSRTRRR